MKKTLIATILILMLVIAALLVRDSWRSLGPSKAASPTPIAPHSPASAHAKPADPLNATYAFDDEKVTLANGTAEGDAMPDSVERSSYVVYGTPVTGDLNGDDAPDAALIIVEEGAGTGTFFSVAAAISEPSGTKGTNAVFLGDRIKPQKIDILDHTIVVTYLDRGPDDPMTADPTVQKTKEVVLDGTTLEELQ